MPPFAQIFLPLAAGALVAAAIWRAFRCSEAPGVDSAGRYAVRDSLLSPAERSFAGVISRVVPAEFVLCYKVRLGDIVTTKRGLSAAVRRGAWSKINQKHVDFLLVRADDFRPVAAIELDDATHLEAERKKRDQFVDQVLKAGGVAVIRIPAKQTYQPKELQQRLVMSIPREHLSRPIMGESKTASDPSQHQHEAVLNATFPNR